MSWAICKNLKTHSGNEYLHIFKHLIANKIIPVQVPNVKETSVD